MIFSQIQCNQPNYFSLRIYPQTAGIQSNPDQLHPTQLLSSDKTVRSNRAKSNKQYQMGQSTQIQLID